MTQPTTAEALAAEAVALAETIGRERFADFLDKHRSATRAAALREAADAVLNDAPLRTELGPYMDVILQRVADLLRRMAEEARS